MPALMDVIVFGATGMVGQGVVRECLIDADVRRVVTVGRTPYGKSDPKLQDIVQPDLFDLSGLERQLTGLDACFFCLGVSAAAGMSERDYARLNYELPVGVATLLARLNPKMTFVYVSGTGTDSTERGRTMWARVKGKTENALLRLPFKAAYMFRPGLIQPLHGIRSKTKAYRVFYTLSAPILPLLKRLLPSVTTTEQIGRAMLIVAKRGAPKAIFEAGDISRLK